MKQYHEAWSKCPFCGAHNGSYGSKLESHRPRCRWIGVANKFDLGHPNQSQMIAEDDKSYLSMLHAQLENVKLKKDLEKALNSVQNLLANKINHD